MRRVFSLQWLRLLLQLSILSGFGHRLFGQQLNLTLKVVDSLGSILLQFLDLALQVVNSGSIFLRLDLLLTYQGQSASLGRSRHIVVVATFVPLLIEV